MNLNDKQIYELVRRIDLRDPAGRETWKLLLQSKLPIHREVIHLLKRNNLYLTTRLAELVAWRME